MTALCVELQDVGLFVGMLVAFGGFGALIIATVREIWR